MEEDSKSNEYNKGLLYIILVYTIWGLLPAYWKLLHNVQPILILSHRILWSFVFVALLISLFYRSEEILLTLKNKKDLVSILLASIVITINWGTYIWAIVKDHLIEASMGYYINPIIVVLFSMIFFQEKMNKAKLVSVMLAFIGVAIMIVGYNKVPILALTLAISFAFYGVIKKKLQINALTSLFFETLFLLPVALIYALYMEINEVSYFVTLDIKNALLLIGAGITTSVPLILFAAGAKRVSFSSVGFFQYIAPTITLFMGVFIYHEKFDVSHWLTFGFIWTALVIYTTSNVMNMKRKSTLE